MNLASKLRPHLPAVVIVILLCCICWLSVLIYQDYKVSTIAPLDTSVADDHDTITLVRNLVDDEVFADISRQLKEGGDVDVLQTIVTKDSISRDADRVSFLATDTTSQYSYLIQVFTNQSPSYVIVSCAPATQQLASKTDCVEHFSLENEEVYE